MAKQTKKRPGSQGRRTNRAKTSVRDTPLAVFDSLCREVIDTQGRDVLASGDPLEAEMWASQLVGLFAGLPLVGESDPVEAIGGRLVTVARERSTAQAGMCLRALSAVANGKLATAARGASKARVSAGSPALSWINQIGTAEATCAWRASDLCGDQDSIMIGFRYPDGREHCLMILVDHVLGGIAKDATILSTPLEAVLPAWRRDADIELVAEPVGQAAGRVMEAVVRTSRTIDAPVSDDFVDAIALVQARLRPLAESIPERQPLAETEREALVLSFLADGEGRQFAHDPGAWFLLDALVDYRCEHGGDPLRWGGGPAELFLLDWVPRKLTVPPAVLERAAEVLRGWIRWASSRSGLPEHLADQALAVIADLGSEPVEALADQSRWGPAERIATRMFAAGVDLTDSGAVEEWLSRPGG